MCFSAAASFGASAILSGVGILATRQVTEPKQRAFAAIPFIFAIQQLTEGFVWLSLTQASWAEWTRPSSFIFLFFAEVLWPMWVPFAMLLLEKDQRTRRVLRIIFGLGFIFVLLAFEYLYCADCRPPCVVQTLFSAHFCCFHLDRLRHRYRYARFSFFCNQHVGLWPADGAFVSGHPVFLSQLCHFGLVLFCGADECFCGGAVGDQ